MPHNNTIGNVLHVAKQINNGRTQDDVFKHMMTEVGELAQEICIRDGIIDKPVGADGIIGEAIDVIACALDIIYLENPEITTADIEEIMQRKLKKWINKYG